jgi:hypothetical protein
MRSFLHLAAFAAATAFVVPARRDALTRRAAHDDSDTITQLIDAKEAELADADAVTTTKTTTTMPNYVEQANYFDGDRPAPAWELAQTNFLKQGATILGQIGEAVGLQKRDPGAVPASLGLVLSNEAVTEAERKREASGGRVDAHPVSRKLYDVGCLFLDTLFDERPIQRFWFLEVIARIPYFSYVSMLHLYESFGWWRGPELRKVHNAEEWNELHHLLIMESLGGNSLWSDRFLGYHVAIGSHLCRRRRRVDGVGRTQAIVRAVALSSQLVFPHRLLLDPQRRILLQSSHRVPVHGTVGGARRRHVRHVRRAEPRAAGGAAGARRRDVVLLVGRPLPLRRLPGLDAAGDAPPGLRDLARCLHEYFD